MINIPPFPLPSDISKEIRFRVPLVDDCMMLSDMDPEKDEAATTQFLNKIQDTENPNHVWYDSADWTGEDRRTALWWLYISTHNDKSLSFSYQVNDETKVLDIDLTELGDTAITLSIKPEIPIEFTCGELSYTGHVVPLNGRALEQLEHLQILRRSFPDNSLDYRKLSDKISIREAVYSLKIDGEPDNFSDALDYRYKIITSMPLDFCFRSFMAKMIDAKRKLTHGLLTTYEDGIYYLVASVELEEGKGLEPFMFPFEHSAFLPTF